MKINGLRKGKAEIRKKNAHPPSVLPPPPQAPLIYPTPAQHPDSVWALTRKMDAGQVISHLSYCRPVIGYRLSCLGVFFSFSFLVILYFVPRVRSDVSRCAGEIMPCMPASCTPTPIPMHRHGDAHHLPTFPGRGRPEQNE